MPLMTGVVTTSDILRLFWTDCPTRQIFDPGTVLTANDQANLGVVATVLANSYWGPLAPATVGVIPAPFVQFYPPDMPSENLRAKPTAAEVMARWREAQVAANDLRARDRRAELLAGYGGNDGLLTAISVLLTLTEMLYAEADLHWNGLKLTSFNNNQKPARAANWAVPPGYAALRAAVNDINSYQPAPVP